MTTFGSRMELKGAGSRGRSLLDKTSGFPSKENAPGTIKTQKYQFCIVKLMLFWGGGRSGSPSRRKGGGQGCILIWNRDGQV